MKTTNELILDLTVRHQFYIDRLGKGNASKAAQLIQDSIEQIEKELGYRWSKIVEGGVAKTGKRSEQHKIAVIAELVKLRYELIAKIDKELFRDLTAAARFEAEFSEKLINKTVPVDIDFVKPSTEAIKTVVSGAVVDGRLVKEHISSMKRRERDQLNKLIGIGIVRGSSYSQIIKAFKDDNNRFERGVSALIRTATHTAMTNARKETFKNSDVVKGWKIVATLDSRTSPICQRKDNQVLPLDSNDFPPYHYNCRTTVIPITKSWRELGIDKDEIPAGTRASMNGQVPADLSYGEWIKSQPFEVQRDALGATRANLLRTGKISVNKLIDSNSNKFITVKELQKRYNNRFKDIFDS